MIEAWTWPAYVGVLLGVLFFGVIFAPVLIWESRRFGQIRFLRVVGAAMAAVYGVALIAYTLLPFPDAAWCAANPTPPRNLNPGAFVQDLLTYYRAHGLEQLLQSFVFLQVAFNVVLFLPFGALWRRYFGGGVFTATVLGFFTSCLIEVSQTTGAMGLLPCAYRVGDVDDVIMNTTGAFLGALLAGALLFFVPDARDASTRRNQPRRVTRLRRIIGMFIDFVILTAAQLFLLAGWRATQVYILDVPTSLIDPDGDTLWTELASLILVVVLPWFTHTGASLGQRAMWLEPSYPKPSFFRRVLRSLTGFGGWAILTFLSEVPTMPEQASQILGGAAALLALLTLIFVIVDPSARGLSLKAAGGEMVDSRS